MQKYKPNFIFLDKACDTVKKNSGAPFIKYKWHITHHI